MKSSPQTIRCATVRSDNGSDNILPVQCPSISTPSSIGSSFSKMTSISSPFSDLLEASVNSSDVQVQEEFLPPFLSSVRDPITITTENELKSFLEELSVSLVTTDDAWDKRMESLTSLERLIAGGSIGLFHAKANTNLSIVTFFRKMPIEAQIEDLRSLLTGQACKVVAALAYTLGDDFAPLAEKWIPSILRLSISGVRVMAQQGMNCVMQITSFPGFGHPRLIPLFLDGCMSKQHQNYKRSCILALTNALRVWGCQSILEKHLRVISKAILAAASDRDPNVREDGRKGFWALHDRFETSAIEMLGLVDRGLRKRLELAKQDANLEWKDGGNMNLISRGYDVSMVLSQQDNSAIACSGGEGSSYTIGTRTQSIKNSGGITKPALKTQKPSLNAAIPDTTWKPKSCITSSRQDAPNFTAKTIKKKTTKLPIASVEAVQPVPMRKQYQNFNLAIRSRHPRSLTCTKKGNSHLDIENLTITPVKTAPSVASEQDSPQCILNPSSSAPREIFKFNAFPIVTMDKILSYKKATTDSTPVEQDMADSPLLDKEWNRMAHLKNVKPPGNTTAPTTATSSDVNFEPNVVVEQMGSISHKVYPPVKSDSLVDSISGSKHPTDNQQNVGNTNFVSRSPLEIVNRSTVPLEFVSRPSPISAVKYCRDSIDTEIDFILRELNNCRLSQDLYLAMQLVLQLARDDEYCAVWDKRLVEILRSILKGTIHIPARRVSQNTEDVAEARHLYLQGLRVLIKYHSQKFEDFIDEVVKAMILCSNDVNSYIVHAAECVLEGLIATQNPSSFFAAILPHLEYPAQGVHDDFGFSLSALRVTTKLVRRLDPEVVKKALPTLYPPLLLSIADDSVEIRKATVFLFVEMMLLFEDTGYPPLLLDQLTLPQRRLVFYFANRRRKQ